METRKRTRKTTSKTNNKLTAPKKIKILFTIIERSKVDFYLDILEGFEVNLQSVIYGRGTATREIMHYLGLIQDDKAVIISVVKEEKIKEIMTSYEDKYFKTRHGKGIAFTVPISSVIGVSLYQFLSNTRGGE